MKKASCYIQTILSAAAFFVCFGCQSKGPTQPVLSEGEFVIEGHLPADRYENAVLFLVPEQGPHPRPVDSVFVSKDGSFRFTGNVEQVACLRLSRKVRMGIQDLLVVTEPGLTKVVLDSVSSSSGTPQNDALQRFKDHRFEMGKAYRGYYEYREVATPEAADDSLRVLRKRDGDFNYELLKEQGRNTLSLFLFKMTANSMDSLQREELRPLLTDTVDYSKPQPGFRK
ncbi:MAG: DUF4369 domain-containing protein [Bacteroidales bacterium]|nr:DUF4369 domain-containing protein [Bacteroidales bacterium]